MYEPGSVAPAGWRSAEGSPSIVPLPRTGSGVVFGAVVIEAAATAEPGGVVVGAIDGAGDIDAPGLFSAMTASSAVRISPAVAKRSSGRGAIARCTSPARSRGTSGMR